MSGIATGTLTGIKRSAMVLGAVCLFFAVDVSGQTSEHPSSTAASSQQVKDGTTQAGLESQALATDILTNTRGVDFTPYLRQVLPMIKTSWLPLIPEEARTPQNLQGETVIRFTINPDGKIGEMHLDSSTRQVKLDRAAWGAIRAVGQFPPLPTNFRGPYLELRIHFIVNRPAPINP
jgi:TonB family protein